MSKTLKRREFLTQTAKAGLGIAVGSSFIHMDAENLLPALDLYPFQHEPLKTVRIGMVGVGGMGTSHVKNFLRIENCEIVAICDINPQHAQRAQKLVTDAGFNSPELFTDGDEDFKRLCRRKDIDLVFTATPWEWHVPVCLSALNSGKHAATEVPAALTIADAWKLIETSEKTGKHCIMMENCNYDREEMIFLNMVKQGVLGELLHARCGYLHDLRAVKHDMNGEGLWRRNHAMVRNGDFYPTHGLGPVSQCLDINRGNYFDYLVSFSTKTRGLHLYAEKEFGPDSPEAQEKFKLGDVVSTLIRTKRGETILVTHDTSSPRPYSRDILVQGTHGIVRKYPSPKVHIEDVTEGHGWDDLKVWQDKYEHPLWKKMESEAKGAGHGGMDFIEDYRLIDALLAGREPDMDVYDAAILSSIVELSAKSIESGSQPVAIPDFTRGMWKTPRELQVMR